MQTTIELPPPLEMTMPFSQVLGRRRSRREFSDQSLDLPLLSTLLWACAGQNGADGRRTAPSALDSREVECFVFDQKGVWSYCAETMLSSFLPRVITARLPLRGKTSCIRLPSR